MSAQKICPKCGATYDDAVAFCATDGTRLVRGGQAGDLIGTVVAERYRIVSRIGEGGMGQVYLAEHVRMKRKSAIKIMRPGLVGDVEALQRFTREAENASQLSHPNIASIFDFGETPDGVVYLAMEYVDGPSLAARLEESTALHPDVAADILGQAADALQAAHDFNMLHRDIKPDNIMLGLRADGTYMVKLVDFGIARTMDNSSDQKVTRTGYAVGTPQYMSPEQLAGESLNAKSDQYSLALVAYYALTGKQAFPAESSKESLIARLTSRPQSLQKAREDVEWPETLQLIFDRALAPEPDDRFESVSGFAHALSGAISDMAPSQTAELYRRALDVRIANVAARTPHSDQHALRTPSGQMLLGAAAADRELVARTGASSSLTPAGVADGTAEISTAKKPRARWPFIIGGVVTASVAATLFMTQGGPAPTADSVGADTASAVTVAVAPPTDSAAQAAAAAAAVASGAPTIGTPTTGTPAATPPGAKPAGAAPAGPSKAQTDSIRRAKTDSVKRDSAKREAARREKAAADSIARVNSLRARYPEAAGRAVIARGIDTKRYILKSGDVRAVIMPTPLFVWRAAQARAFKDNTTRPGANPSDPVDPMEQWDAWNNLSSNWRAVYVLEVTSDKVPWPQLQPDKIFDLRKGDIASVEVMRDGSSVSLEHEASVPAVVNGPAHVSGGKPVSKAVVAVIPPSAFTLREDGALPRIELLIREVSRPTITRIVLSETMVRRLYDDFAPWRDVLARP